MDNRKHGHDQFRNLYKAASKEKLSATPPTARARSSSQNSPFKNAKPIRSDVSSKSSKSTKGKKSGGRSKPTGKRSDKRTAPSVKARPSPNGKPQSDNSNRRASKSPHPRPQTPKTPKTPPATARTPDKKKTPTKKWQGKDVQETTQMCNTVFENDAGVVAIPGGGGGHIQLAQARIKERKLQWKKEEPSSDPSGGSDDLPPLQKKRSREEMKIPEAYATVKQRTFFENDTSPAPVKEEEKKLQWMIPDAAVHETTSEPEVRKKRTPEKRGTLSERPLREDPPIKPQRGAPAMRLPVTTPPRTPPAVRKSPVAVTPPRETMSARSPIARPVMLDVQTTDFGQGTAATATSSEKEKPVSCYIAPTFQHQEFGSADPEKKRHPDSETYDYPDGKN